MASIPQPVVILGARSDIGRALAHRYAEQGASVVLAARRAAELEADRADIEVRYGQKASVVEFDVNSADPDALFAALGQAPGTVVMVAGLLGDQPTSSKDDAAARLVMETNYTGPARVLLAAARAMAGREGCIVGISSVAGDRGRGSNFVYGSAKAGLTAFLSGLRNALAAQNIHVMTVKPGFVNTAMTEGMKLPPMLTAEADEVARAIVEAQKRGRDVIYVRPIWRLIMTIIVAIPERVFKTLKL